MFDKKIIRRFVSDYKLPIQIFNHEYFYYYIILYNNYFGTKRKFAMLKDSIKKCGSEQNFLDSYYNIRNEIIATIEGTEAYQKYNSMDMNKFNVLHNYSAKDVFKKQNIGKDFMSIDLKKANFQALRYLNPDIVLGYDSYEKLLDQFTNLEYIKNSKYLRQVIFGNMNPKRQVKIERYMTQQILDMLLKDYGLLTNNIYMVSNDEIVISPIGSKTLAQEIKKNLNFDVDVETYNLECIGNTNFYVKRFINKEDGPGYEIMCVPPYFFAQVYKYINNLELNDKDLSFFFENQICKFTEPLNFDMEDMKNECEADRESA